LTCIVGVLLAGTAIAIPSYAFAADAHVSDLGWLVVMVFGFIGLLLLRRSATWNDPVRCPHCGAAVARSLEVCPRCGFNFEAATWAAIGKLKMP
jgi:hypothetical protein